eukprot:TRINITY_DN4138_c0_g2_i1.p1 TRINITY_DN4138_c0_g2~~TRINITY_DN4138_c0_g2_i1.p1  ORF type:complete len:143 (-),score=26.56 TRINITY_DN4138_c0_g2_i1:54-482(-)
MVSKYTHWFPLAIFQDRKAAKPFQCSICEHVPAPDFAVTHDKCKATFCYSCILSWTFAGNGCSKCGERIETRVSEGTGEKMQKLVVSCPWHKECQWIGKVSEMNAHKVARKKYVIKIKQTSITKLEEKNLKRKALGDLGNES